MGKYKLTYFPVMAIGEPIRWLLLYGKLDFEDIRITHEVWEEKYKENSPLGVVPILEIDGKMMIQSIAICRYLGNIVGLSGNNAIENYEIDAAVDTVCDLRAKIGIYNRMKDDSPERPPLKEALMKETIPFFLSRIEKMASNGYLPLDRMSWADIFFVALLDYMNGVLKEDIVDIGKYPNLHNIAFEVRRIPAIAEWIQTRPYSEY